MSYAQNSRCDTPGSSPISSPMGPSQKFAHSQGVLNKYYQ